MLLNEIRKRVGDINFRSIFIDHDQLRFPFFCLQEPQKKLTVREREFDFAITSISQLKTSFGCIVFCEFKSDIVGCEYPCLLYTSPSPRD